jgi:HEAT repeat protein
LGDTASASAMRGLLDRTDLPPDIARDALIARAIHKDSGAALALVKLLRETADIYQKIEIIAVLGKAGTLAVVPELLRQMKSLRLRRYLIEALGNLGAKAARGPLVEILRDARFISWREKAAVALGQIGGPSAVNALLSAYASDPEPTVVRKCHQAIAELGALDRIGSKRVFSQTSSEAKPNPR